MRRIAWVLCFSLVLSSCSATGASAALFPRKKSSSSASSRKIVRKPVTTAPIQQPIVRPENFTLPILVYHHVRDTKPYPKTTWSWKMSVSPSVFDAQMKWLVDHGYTTVDLSTAADILKTKQGGPMKPVVITFDDNNSSQITDALPILKKYGLKATFYIITSRIGTSTITREQLKDLVAQGMDVQSHTVHHDGLSTLGAATIDKEILESRKTLEEITGKSVVHLAYPLTMQNATVRERMKNAGYITGTIMDPRPANLKDDMMKLPRIMMTDDTDLTKTLP